MIYICGVVSCQFISYGLLYVLSIAYSMANTLYWAHSAGTLLIDIAMSISTSESVFHHTFYNYNATMKMYGVDTNVPDSKEYCLCQDTT